VRPLPIHLNLQPRQEPIVDDRKSWEKAWSDKELREGVKEWTLASDAGLLNNLKELSDSIVNQSKQLSDIVEDLLYDTQATEVKLNNTFNSFLNLAHFQYVENRVYDEAPIIKPDSQGQQPPGESVEGNVDNIIIPKYTEAISYALKALEKAFLKDEDDDKEITEADRKKHNVWFKRPLPCLFFSEEYRNDTVGLFVEESSEEEEIHYDAGLPAASVDSSGAPVPPPSLDNSSQPAVVSNTSAPAPPPPPSMSNSQSIKKQESQDDLFKVDPTPLSKSNRSESSSRSEEKEKKKKPKKPKKSKKASVSEESSKSAEESAPPKKVEKKSTKSDDEESAAPAKKEEKKKKDIFDDEEEESDDLFGEKKKQRRKKRASLYLPPLKALPLNPKKKKEMMILIKVQKVQMIYSVIKRRSLLKLMI